MNIKIQSGESNSSFALANYLEHEDFERIQDGKGVEHFFNLTEDQVSKKELIKDIDNNKAKLCKSDTKFFHVIVSPSEKEVAVMGKTSQEQSANLKKYIRQDIIPQYAESFNKGLSAKDIKFYCKIHHDREKSDSKEGQIHCHIIISRKDMSNTIKLSPMTTHTGKKAMGTVKGGFHKNEFYQNTETAFDKRFNYSRTREETFAYCNTIKNGSIEQIREQAIRSVQAEKERETSKQKQKEKNNPKEIEI